MPLLARAMKSKSPLDWMSECLLLAASSTDRRNTGVKSICRRLERQGLARPPIELAGHLVQMCLGVDRQVCPLGEVLAQQAIGVLVGAALPGALRIAEVHGDVGCQGKSSMIRKLLTTVPGQGFVQFIRQLLRLPDERGYHRLRLLVGHLRQHHITRMALTQGRDMAVLRPRQQVTLPMTRHRPVFNRRRSLADRDKVRDLSSPIPFRTCALCARY